MIRSIFCCAVLALAHAAAQAQQPAAVKTIERSADPAAIPLGTGGVKNSVAPESWVDYYGYPMLRNVQQATLAMVAAATLTDSGIARMRIASLSSRSMA